jgi:hypothetical protein
MEEYILTFTNLLLKVSYHEEIVYEYKYNNDIEDEGINFDYKYNNVIKYLSSLLLYPFFIFSNNDDIYLLHLDDDDWNKIIIYNFKTKESIIIDPSYKGGSSKIHIYPQHNLIITYGYKIGMVLKYDFYTLKGEEYDVNEDINFTSVDSITFNEDSIIFNNVVPKKYFSDKYKSIDKIDISLFNQTDENYFIPIYDLFSKKKLIDDSYINKFIQSCKEYDVLCKSITSFFNNDRNLFFIFAKENIKNTSIERGDGVEDIINLSKDSIFNMKLKGLYTGKNYTNHLDYYFQKRVDDDFVDWLPQICLGSFYQCHKYVKKEDLPNGIGLVFTITDINNITYSLTIKMELFELEEGKLFYVKDKCVLNVKFEKYNLKTENKCN